MMPHLTGLTDVSAWTGTWPFDLNGHVSLDRLSGRLASAGIVDALVCSLDAVLAPDPMPANRELLAAIEAASDLPVQLRPVPVVNPLLATWLEDLADLVERARGAIPAVRLLPTWHGWGPDTPGAGECLGVVSSIDMMPIVQARMVDERAMPVASSPSVFDVQEVADWLGLFPDVPVVLAGLYRAELQHIAGLDHVSVDLAFIESGDTLATVLETLPPERVLLGTHAPLLEPLAAVAKLPLKGPHRDAAVRIGTETARDMFGLSL